MEKKSRSIAIPFIKYDIETGGFQINQEAADFLSQL
jgi:hypothetical protein